MRPTRPRPSLFRAAASPTPALFVFTTLYSTIFLLLAGGGRDRHDHRMTILFDSSRVESVSSIRFVSSRLVSTDSTRCDYFILCYICLYMELVGHSSHIEGVAVNELMFGFVMYHR